MLIVFVGSLIFEVADNYIQPVLIWALFDLTPASVLLLLYYLHNRNEEYEFTPDEIIWRKGNEERRYLRSDIIRIVFRMSASKVKGSEVQFLSIGSYYYAKITFKNGEDLILTYLLNEKLDKVFDQAGLRYEKEKGLFNIV
jgi:hypothetical protein